MMVTTGTIVGWAGLLAAISALLGALFKVHTWILRQEQQDKEIADIKAELKILSKGMLASLDGLEQLGCNHIVPDTKNMLSEHINNKAHE